MCTALLMADLAAYVVAFQCNMTIFCRQPNMHVCSHLQSDLTLPSGDTIIITVNLRFLHSAL